MQQCRTILFVFIALAGSTLCSCANDGFAEIAKNAKCEQLEKRFEQALAAGGACSADADCACYGQSTRVSKCGGVTDGKTAEGLAAIAKDFYALKCPRFYRCAPWECVPACYKGGCVSGLLKKSMERSIPSGKKQTMRSPKAGADRPAGENIEQ